MLLTRDPFELPRADVCGERRVGKLYPNFDENGIFGLFSVLSAPIVASKYSFTAVSTEKTIY